MAPYYQQGEYPAVIVEQGFVESDYGWQFLLKIRPESTGEDGYERTIFLPLTDANGQRAQFATGGDAAGRSIEVLRYLGFAGGEANLAKLDPAHPDHHSFVGREVKAYCKHNDNGTKERWYINTPRTVTPDKITFKKLQSLFGKELKEPPVEANDGSKPLQPAAKQETVDTSPEAVEEAKAAEGGDDIPF